MKLFAGVLLLIVACAPLRVYGDLVGSGGVNLQVRVENPLVPEIVPPGGGGGGGPQTASVNFYGIAYPGATVTLLDNGDEVESQLIDSTGDFHFRLSDIDNGVHAFAFFATDKSGRYSNLQSFYLQLQPGVSTTVNGIFLSPTVAISKSQVKIGDLLTVDGQAARNSQVSILVTGPGRSYDYDTTADSQGLYQLDLASVAWPIGPYSLQAVAKRGWLQSEPSLPLAFTVGEVSLPPVLDPCLSLGRKSLLGDLNNDCRVNLKDFSIIFYWLEQRGYLPEADLNHDGVITLKDFSIAIHDWTG